MEGLEKTINLWDDCCVYAQQVNEIARVWHQQSADLSNPNGAVCDKTTLTINSKS